LGTRICVRVASTLLAAGLLLAAMPGEGQARKFDRFAITPMTGYVYQDLGDLQSQIGAWNRALAYYSTIQPGIGNAHAEDIGLGYSIMGDVRYRVGPRMWAALRAEYITDNSSTLAAVFGNEFSAAAVPITVTGMYEFPGLLPSFLRKATIRVGVGAGVVMRGVYKFEIYIPVNSYLTARATSRGFQMHGLAEIEYPFFDRWAVVAEACYRYTSMGELTYRSVSGEDDTVRGVWEGDPRTGVPGIFGGSPFPVEGDKVIYNAAGDAMKLDFSGVNFLVGLRLYAF
jgi:hypothetical protein